jgi:SAM-dependent methyltransferase
MNVCPACGHQAVVDLGPIPDANYFAGRTLDHVLKGGSLYRCERCSLGYRFPCPPKEELDELYRQGSSTAWQSDPGQRVDWRLAKQQIERRCANNPAVLDIGCFDGAFLASLETPRRFGVEINPAGIERARQRGVEILGHDYNNVNAGPTDFDVITNFDMIEHIEDPRTFFASLITRLRRGGLLVISTGDLDAWTWRMARGRYWYCAIPEHISYCSRRWFSGMSGELGLEPVEMTSFSHSNWSLVHATREVVTNGLYLFAPGVARFLRAKGVGMKDVTAHPELLDYPPSWISARDHLLAVFRKPR